MYRSIRTSGSILNFNFNPRLRPPLPDWDTLKIGGLADNTKPFDAIVNPPLNF